MKAYILKMNVKGIKNIDKEIELNFYNKTIKNQIEFQSNIKSIYGTNGSGKSGIIHAIDIYKKLIVYPNFLSDNANIKYLKEIVNKRLNEFSIKLVYVFYDETNNEITDKYEHFVKINVENDVKILEEEMNKYYGSKLDKKKCVVKIENGKIVDSDYDEMDKYVEYTINLLSKRPFSNIIFYKEFENNKIVLNAPYSFVSPLLLAMEISIKLPKDDEHIDYLYTNTYSDLFIEQLEYKKFERKSHYYSLSFSDGDDLIDYDEKERYKEKITKLTRFLQLFKPTLKKIEVVYEEKDKHFVCKKYLCYEDCRIYSQFESTGIRKLIRLFYVLNELNKGGIVFIDELDANLHDVYFSKLIDYFSMYGKGQLCFTSHNLAPMSTLSKRKHGIDFLSDDSVLIPWIKNGNFSVVNLYRNGMIEHSPFNIEPFDFLGIFEED